MKRFALALFSTLAFASAAHAAEYGKVLAEQSRIGFGYQQMGVSMDGSFKQFDGQLRFDPAAPEAASAVVEVELASIDTGSDEGDEEVAAKTWFNTAAFPKARFESTGVKALGGNNYEVAGKLTIKGTTRDVVVPATFTEQGGTGVFDGTLTIKRGDFSVGEGAWKAFDIVANDVSINFRIAAAAQ
ncbi:YceI family protein [Thauera butanivorans]|uniref:YceI family protein n=1 Tax=Thauera butanivorans TaxID=86174 RepID=UPI000838B92F|nr:YceI family protein [Thauera butanivorans]